MASIIIADKTRHYDGRYLETRALGGTESSVIQLARQLARRRHEVTVYTNCDGPIEHEGVRWKPLSETPPTTCDVYIAVHQPELLSFVKRPKRRAIWVVWPVNQLKHYKKIWRVWWYRPVPVLISLHQARTYSPFLPRRDPHIVIPHGLPDDVRGHPPLQHIPPRRAIFTSRPTLNLRELVEIWAARVFPRVPEAVLDVYGVHDLQPGQDPWRVWEGSHLPVGVPSLVKRSVQVHPSVSRKALIEAIRSSRVLLYLGHKAEAFCLAVAEAQALGVPAVVGPVAAVPERVIDGVTGFHRADPQQFADAAVAILTDEGLWRRQHEAALRQRQGISWSEAAGRFEAALLGDRIPLYRSVLQGDLR
jgi:glycosyltransferase involved in cell wall biosynthesis